MSIRVDVHAMAVLALSVGCQPPVEGPEAPAVLRTTLGEADGGSAERRGEPPQPNEPEPPEHVVAAPADAPVDVRAVAQQVREQLERSPSVAVLGVIVDEETEFRRWREGGRRKLEIIHHVTIDVRELLHTDGEQVPKRLRVRYVRSGHHLHLDGGQTYVMLLARGPSGLEPIYAEGSGAVNERVLRNRGITPHHYIRAILE